MPRKYNPNRDPIETTFTIDHDLRVVHCWSNHKPTIKQLIRDFPDKVVLGTGDSIFLNGVRLPEVRKIKVVPKRKLTKEHIEKLTYTKLAKKTHSNTVKIDE